MCKKCPKLSIDKAAELLNVSPRSVKQAGKVIHQGTPELIHAVESGELSVSAASIIADEPKEEQQIIIVMVKKQKFIILSVPCSYARFPLWVKL